MLELTLNEASVSLTGSTSESLGCKVRAFWFLRVAGSGGGLQLHYLYLQDIYLHLKLLYYGS